MGSVIDWGSSVYEADLDGSVWFTHSNTVYRLDARFDDTFSVFLTCYIVYLHSI